MSTHSNTHAASPPCLVFKKPLCRCGLVLTCPNVSSYAPCAPSGCHLCLRCCPGPLGFARALASFSAGDTQQLAGPILPPCSSFPLAPRIPWLSPGLHLCRILCILVLCSRLVKVLHAESSQRLTFLSLPGSSPSSLQPDPHPKSSLLPAVSCGPVSRAGRLLSVPACACIARAAWARMGSLKGQELPSLREGLDLCSGLQ